MLLSSFNGIIALPPRGMFIRDLTLSFISAFVTTTSKLNRACHTTYDHDKVSIVLEGQNDWSLVTQSLMRTAQNLLQLKRSILRCPQMHVNDYKYVFKDLLGAKVSNTSSYLDAFSSLIADPNYCNALSNPNVARHLASLRFDGSKIFLGLSGKSYALLQPFKVETYEHGLTFHSPYTMDLEIRITTPWLLVLGVGFAFSYAGMTFEGLSFISPDEDSLSDPYKMRLSTAIDITSSILGVPVDPVIPYSMYLSFSIPELLSASKSSELLRCDMKDLEEYLLSDQEVASLSGGELLPRIKLQKMSTTIRAYTTILRESVDLSLLVKYAYLLDKVTGNSNCRKTVVNNIIRRALGGRDPKSLNAAILLYEAIQGAKDPYYSIYFIARNFQLSPQEVEGMLKVFDELWR